MAWYDPIVGRSWGQRVVIGLTVVVYAWLVVARPQDAVASAIGTLLSEEAVGGLLGSAAGVRGVLLAGGLGGLLPGGPYAVYPIISSIGAQGASLAAVIAMLIGYGAIGIGRLPYGLVFFDVRTVATRVAVGIVGTAAVALVAVVVL